MTAIDRHTRALELVTLPGELFEAIHPAIDFNRSEALRERPDRAAAAAAGGKEGS